MLTEGWDANTVTHILGIRAFGTQLLCEQVIGRALRRQSYDLNEEGLVQRRIRRHFRHPVRFHRQPGHRAAAASSRARPCRSRLSPEWDALEIRFPRVEGYRVELPEERLTADFNDDSVLELSPDLVGPSITQNSGIIGEGVDMSLEHLGDMRPSITRVSSHAPAALHQMARPRRRAEADPVRPAQAHRQAMARYCLVCKGGTYPAQLMYQELADMACNRITAAITRKFLGERPIKALLDPYNHTGSTRHVRFNTSRADRWETNGPPPKNQVNWVILDSDWEAEFCRVAEAHPKVIAYTKNHNLGLEVPYRYGSENRKYLPDFIVRVDDGHGPDDLLNLIVEIKGYRREDAKEKKATMDTYWVPGRQSSRHLWSLGVRRVWRRLRDRDGLRSQGEERI